MALSADEQRALAEIERRLVTDDPGLATCLTAFRRPGPARALGSPRARIIGSLFTVLLVAMVALMVYAMIPFRTHGARTPAIPSAGTPGNVSITVTGTGGQPRSNPPASASTSTSTAGTASTAVKSAASSAGQGAGTGQAKPTGYQAADQVASSATGP
jgi:cytoskeletal protein RodZ